MRSMVFLLKYVFLLLFHVSLNTNLVKLILTTHLKILTSQIRSEIASCSERAYPSLPISSSKNLLFLRSEGEVISFAQSRGWLVRDGRIFFPNQQLEMGGGLEDKDVSKIAIENTLGYARELETIV